MSAAIDQVDAIVVGAGVIGLAIARELGAQGLEVLILEANDRIGEETSARNNEVIHAGFLYPPTSVKGELCLPGRNALYSYCETRGIGHRKLGKLMPAVSDTEVEQLNALAAQARQLGIDDLILLDPTEARELEPSLRCQAALWSPATGIVDTHALMLALLGDAERRGAQLAVRSRALAISPHPAGFVVDIASGASEHIQVACKTLVNAAGLDAERLARSIPGALSAVPTIHFAKGCFYGLTGRAPFRHLIVPMGATLSEGGAFTLDLAGQGRFGPDLEWVNTRDYSVASNRHQQFATAIRRYFPSFDPSGLQPGYSGIRPRLTGPGEPPSDWMIAGPAAHGVPGLVHLLGMDTPGITACLAIASRVWEELNFAQRRRVA